MIITYLQIMNSFYFRLGFKWFVKINDLVEVYTTNKDQVYDL